MARYIVEFKAFKTGEWYTKTETDHIASAHSVALVHSQGRAYRVTDTEEGRILSEGDGEASMYSEYGKKYPSGSPRADSSRSPEVIGTKRDKVLAALKAGEFDGVNHAYEPYKGFGKISYQKEMSVSGGSITLTKISRGKFFDGKENERWEERTTEVLSDFEAVAFIESHPYYFTQRRPDLF